ncbi:hypothetical protein [Roseomonas fluvialis]|uniref:Uncharacterized protein n=1 Tax=Roseomonas fluvialis TaxID=1750527 RepID=A0ABN6P8A5_9PROT|nr:hypothetical protein [Roseomonas fluvialis]BDG74485.1 hypothetical protein Rmf_44140 [Roseomonas fluvialis]
MLRLVAALQAGLATDAVIVLADWLPEDSGGPASIGARRFAAEMATAGLRLATPRHHAALSADALASVARRGAR